IALNAFDSKIRELDAERDPIQKQRETIKRDLANQQQEHARIQNQAQTQTKLRERIAASEPVITEARQEVDTLDREVAALLRALGRTSLPSEIDITDAAQVVQGWQRVLNTRESIEHARTALTTIHHKTTTLRRE